MALVLFIEDDPYAVETLSRAVEIAGHQARPAKTAAEALDILRTTTPDLIFVDINLPDMNGLNLIRLLQQNLITENIPTLVLSAIPKTMFVDNAPTTGIQDYFTKPIRLQALLDTIEKYTTS